MTADPTALNYDSFDAELLAKIDGVKLSVGYHNPFLATDPGLVWLVLKGSVDIYAVPLSDGAVAGTGRHLMRIEAGELIFGMPPIEDDLAAPDGTDRRIGLRAVAIMGTELFRAPRRDLEQDDFDLIVVDWIDRWLTQLSEIVAPGSGARPTALLEAEPDIAHADGAVLAPQRGDVIWTRIEQGEALILGDEGLVLRPDGPLLPMAKNMGLTCRGQCVLSSVYTPTALFRGELWDNLDRFHHLVVHIVRDIRRRDLAVESERLEAKASANRGIFQHALSEIGGVLMGGESAVRAPGLSGNALLEAMMLVGHAVGIRIVAPRQRDERRLETPLADIARHSHIRVRRVVLLENWYRRDNGPLLAFLGPEKHPVALLPDGIAAYRMTDPATGRTVPVTAGIAEELSGEAYVLYRPFPAKALTLGELLRFGARGLKREFQMTAAMGMLAGLVALATPIATGYLFSSIVPRADIDMHLMVIAGLILAAFGTAAFTVTRSFAMLRIQARMDSSIQTAVWDRLLALPIPFFRAYSSGDLADRANGINAIREIMTGTVMQATLNAIFSLFSLALLFWYSWKLAAVAMGVVLLMLGISTALLIVQIPYQRKMIGLSGRLDGLVFQLLTGISKLRISGSEPRAFARWSEEFTHVNRLGYKLRYLNALQQMMVEIFPVIAAMILFAAIIWMLDQPAVAGQSRGFGIGDFLSFNAAFGQFSLAMMGLLGIANTMLAVVPLYERVKPILETLPEISADKADPGAIDGDIEFSRIIFHYDDSAPPVINDVSLTIESGSYVAFVGASGSGKSTLVRLLLGFEQPQSGGVYIDGKDLSGLDMMAVRRQIGVVLQNGRIMAGSIFDNIVGSLPLTLDDAWEAARMAGFAQDIEQMPMGMHTVLSDGAGTLSGGQRQRLMIARALVHKPRILILDEATSALDNQTQAIVNNSLAKMNMTRLVVAHRLSTIEHVDRIFVMRHGRIIESGDFNSLMALDGEFADLARRQIL
ncbi:NHLP bacteriocin export ABC transporter permease/ATPase subunit [Oceanibaculum pacificum]|uniref:ATP-binding protein n=1 Tax=Oceanibaculum pacificum TaxID=580166 RepID=A0A154W749_9PROT|nr:NHLP bacteriocin export ABC transporter permease/ATPase subunit [Oceanibaculum pacificum]KZD09301.1 ATP-binding protein [Oceanibaculum pacificum]